MDHGQARLPSMRQLRQEACRPNAPKKLASLVAGTLARDVIAPEPAWFDQCQPTRLDNGPGNARWRHGKRE